MGKEWKFYCTTYALIDNRGKCEIIIERFYPKSEITYCKINLDKEEIDSILNSSMKITKELDLRPKIGTSMYDGPSLKVRINKNSTSKTIHFFDDEKNDSRIFVKLYETINSSFMKKNYEGLEVSDFLRQRKLDFINFSMKSDSILRPPPPSPSEVEVKWVGNKE